jgi:hypothetical protein
MKPIRTSTEDTACPRGPKRVNTETQAVIAIKMALMKRDVEATQTSTFLRIILKNLNIGLKLPKMPKAGIGATAKEIVKTKPPRILQLMKGI